MTGTETTKCFADRLQDLISESGKDVKTLAAEIGVSSGALSKYQNDKGEPGITALYKIANYFGVTADYLVGLNHNRTNEYAAIGNITGLSDEAIDVLCDIASQEPMVKDASKVQKACNSFIESEYFEEICNYANIHKLSIDRSIQNLEAYKELLNRLITGEANEAERTPIINRGASLADKLAISLFSAQESAKNFVYLFSKENTKKMCELQIEVQNLYDEYYDSDLCPKHDGPIQRV